MIRLAAHGQAVGVEGWLIGRLVRDPVQTESRRDCVLVCDDPARPPGDLSGYRAVLSERGHDAATPCPRVHSISTTDHLRDGHIVMLTSRGRVLTLYRPESEHNAIFATDRCNNNCLMCSQPPIDRRDDEKVEQNLEVVRLICPPPAALGLTGGEPTLLGEGLFRILRSVRDRLPTTRLHVLTNGRLFARPDFADAFVRSAPTKTTLGVPLHSSVSFEHDYIAQARHAFDQTITGLHRLARSRQDIEVRVVVHALNAHRLADLADYIYRNLPFASHVALMGLEVTGFARRNLSTLWIEPTEYLHELEKSVEYLAVRGMNVSIYNHQLCLLPRWLWKFARKSISDHKTVYDQRCAGCVAQGECGGLFGTSQGVFSARICALTEAY